MLHTLHLSSDPPVQKPKQSHVQHDHRTSSDARASQVNFRILLVDEHRLFRKVVREVLEEQPRFKVIGETASGQQAVDLAAELQPELILLDTHIPDLGGISLIRQLVAAVPQARLVVLALTYEEEHVFQAVQAGAFGYLTKDIQPEALIRALLGVVEGEMAMPRRMVSRMMSRFRQNRSSDTSQRVELTTREIEVLRLLAQGATDRQVAQQLVIAESTAKKHVQHILRKLRARNRAEAVAKFRQYE